MTGKTLNQIVILLLIAAFAVITVSTALAGDSGTVSGNSDPAGALAPAVLRENIEGFDQDLQTKISAPNALTEVSGLTIDPALVNATPYWVYLAAGKNEQQALIDYIHNADILSKQKTEWIQFLQVIWKKYPLKFVKKGSSATLVPVKPVEEYSLTNNEVAIFAEIDKLITFDMTKISSRGIQVMVAGPQHADFMTIAMKNENIPEALILIANQSAKVPDDWYSDDEAGKILHSLNHGYIPLSPTHGLGLAPQNTGTYAFAAKMDFMLHNYNTAFTNLGYSAHFMGDLGQPFHTPNPLFLFTESNWMYYAGPLISNQPTPIQRYIIFHDTYESLVDYYWNNVLPGDTKSLSGYANDANGAAVIVDPAMSATLHADVSSIEIIPVFYLCQWHYIFNKNFDYMTDPVIAGITTDRVTASTENIRGLVRFVTGGQAPILTVTVSAGENGIISPSGPVTVNYGDTPTFIITPDSGYVVEDVKVDSDSKGAITRFTFDSVTTDRTISVTFKPQSLPGIVPLCPAGTPFDSKKYPQNTPQSESMVFACNWDGNGRVYLSGDKSSLIGVYADDGFTVDTYPLVKQFDAEGHWAHQHPPVELTEGMTKGSNTFTLIVRNWKWLSMSYGSSTGIGTDQTPYIIQVNSQTMADIAEKFPTNDMPPSILRSTITNSSLMEVS